ncbi:hypothetical protein FB45DRAFT_1082594 [Roridomyces roridus]|uniref:Uncharacterized protein n=1 Tax=Roridomyces roridus TaxID=1738132 RepID=A0AAD7BR53_9AGAR|nr:hypothetical protein FB45DRAFT_1082594 [Roridomyces roridus]
MHSLLFLSFVPSTLVIITPVLGHGFRLPNYKTNAQRLLSGAPLPRLKRLFGSPASHAPRSVPSGTVFPVDTAESTQTGILGPFATNGSFLGFYRMPGSPLASILGTQSQTPARRSIYPGTYTFTTPSIPGGLFEIQLAQSPAYRLTGIGWSAALTLGPGRGAWVKLIISGVSMPADAPPYINMYETTIYTIDDNTGEVTAHWVNPGTTASIPTTFMWSPARTALVFTADTAAARDDFVTDAGQISAGTALGEDALPVTLYFGGLADWAEYY